MAKILKLDYDYEPINAIFGITTTLRDYRLAFFISKILDTPFKNLEDLPIAIGDGKVHHYPLFIAFCPNIRTHFYLVGNSSQKSILGTLFKQVDYFLFMRGLINDFETLQRQIKTTEGISAVFHLEQNKIKNLSQIITAIDCHLLETEAGNLQ